MKGGNKLVEETKGFSGEVSFFQCDITNDESVDTVRSFNLL